jgi:hypothetical protein
LHTPHIWGAFFAVAFPALHRIALPVVSEWCQYRLSIWFADRPHPLQERGSKRSENRPYLYMSCPT